MIPTQSSRQSSQQSSPHWMTAESKQSWRPTAEPYTARFESIGLHLPADRLTSADLLASLRHHPHIELERLTGIHERRVAAEGEDSLSLAVGAARDCLARSAYDGGDLDMVISCSISKYRSGLRQRYEPPLSLNVKDAIGASGATSFDVSNACAGMLTGVFILNDFIRRGEIRRGMVISGESISQLGTNASKQVRGVLSRQLASLTLGDAGAAVLVDRMPEDQQPHDKNRGGISFASFTTLSEHSRLCLAYPSRIGPGASMYTKARTIHKVAIKDAPPLMQEALTQSGLRFEDIDYLIPHQTSARAIRKGVEEFSTRLGAMPKHVVNNVEQFGNTSSTTHFVALYRYLQEGRFRKGDRIMLLSLASGLEIGVVIIEMDELVERYGSRSEVGGHRGADDVPVVALGPAIG